MQKEIVSQALRRRLRRINFLLFAYHGISRNEEHSSKRLTTITMQYSLTQSGHTSMLSLIGH